jgi:PAS domain S-box-containing protein
MALALGCLSGSWLGFSAAQPALGTLALVLAGVALGVALAFRRHSITPVLDAVDSFRLLIEKAPDFLSVLNADGTVRYRSPSFERFLGYSPGELAGRSTFEFIHPDDRPQALRAFQELMAERGGIRFMELRFRLADGSYRDLDALGSNLLHEPSVAGVVVNSRDITERKRAQRRQAAQLAVTRLLAGSETVAEATPRLLAAAVQGMGWENGELWVPQEGQARLALQERWPRAAGEDAGADHGQALAARTLATGEPSFDDGALAVPVRGGSGVEGVMVFRGSESRPPEIALRDLMVDIGLQLGQFLERRRARDALRLRDDRFRALFENSADAITLLDENAVRIYAGPSTRRVLGYAEEEILGQSILDDVHPEDRGALKVVFAAMLARPGETILCEYRMRHRDGSWRWIEGAGRNLLGTPSVGAVVVNSRDVTDRKEAEAALRKLSRAVDQTADQVVIVDRDRRIEYLNRSFEEHTGYAASELLGRSITLLDSEQNTPEFFAEFWARVQAGLVFSGTFVNRRKDGSLYHVETTVTPLRDAAGEITHFLATGRDITERVRLEADQQRLQGDVHKAALEWRLTFDAIESPVLVVEGPGRLARMNRAAQALACRSYDAIVGSDLATLGPAEPWRTALSLAAAVIETRAARHAQAPDPERGRTWEITANLLAGPDLREERVIVVARDVSRTIELQESLRKSETMSAMGQLVAGVAHEVRNPLFAISANLDALEIQFGDHSPHAKTFAVLHREVDRLSDLMQELLDYGRPHSLEVERCALSEVVGQAIRATTPLARSRDVEVVDTVPGGLPLVPMDAKRIGQVFQNLIENAIQHTGAGGRVLVTAALSGEHEQEQVVCSILDDGSGFREQDLPRIFEPFFTRRRGGTGLGLSIVARIVEEHGGRVTAANRPEGGAVMAVKLPTEPTTVTGAA